jgi:hypothetical protein
MLGLESVIPLFILEASKLQLDIPIKEILSSSLSGSSLACKTFKGLFSECSQSPISSK